MESWPAIITVVACNTDFLGGLSGPTPPLVCNYLSRVVLCTVLAWNTNMNTEIEKNSFIFFRYAPAKKIKSTSNISDPIQADRPM